MNTYGFVMKKTRSAATSTSSPFRIARRSRSTRAAAAMRGARPQQDPPVRDRPPSAQHARRGGDEKRQQHEPGRVLEADREPGHRSAYEVVLAPALLVHAHRAEGGERHRQQGA